MKIGFDLWGTLIKANPEFRVRRQDLFNKHFEARDDNFYSEVMDEIKTDLNKVIEHSGWQPNDELIKTLISDKTGMPIKSVNSFMEDYQRLGILYSPVLIDVNTKDILTELSSKATLTIVSNTMFLKGRTLSKMLIHDDILNCFTYLRFSDEIKIAKPSALISTGFDYFIGDNEQTDGKFAERTNSQFILLNSETTLLDAYNIIIKDRRIS